MTQLAVSTVFYWYAAGTYQARRPRRQRRDRTL